MSVKALYDVAAPAKLNLFLHVVGRRADGYHLLQSLFVLIDWCDTLHFELRTDGRLARHDLGATLPDDDLCLRAARALQKQSGTSLGADISIMKQLPSGAGMGGGSSDAASTLIALNRLWGAHQTRAELLTLALSLGADVPFFVGGSNAFVEGIGERISPISIGLERFAVIKPSAGLQTPAIFADPDLVRNSEAVIVEGLAEAIAENDGYLPDGYGRNDLQPVAAAKCEEIGQVSSWLRARFGNSRMTGSGSAVFARLGQVTDLDANLTEVPNSWTGRMCMGLEAHPLCEWIED